MRHEIPRPYRRSCSPRTRASRVAALLGTARASWRDLIARSRSRLPRAFAADASGQLNSSCPIPPMQATLCRTRLYPLTCMLVVAWALLSSPAAARAEPPPWVISNGQVNAGLYVPRDVQQAYAKGTRSLVGRPGPNYWQNHAEHRIRISLNPPSRRSSMCRPMTRRSSMVSGGRRPIRLTTGRHRLTTTRLAARLPPV